MADESSRPKNNSDPKDASKAPEEVLEDQDQYEYEDEYEEIDDDESSPWHAVFTAMPAWLISTLVHLAALLILATIPLLVAIEEEQQMLVAAPGENEEIEELEEFLDEPLEELNLTENDVQEFEATEIQAEDVDFSAFDEQAALTSVDLSDFSTEKAPISELITAGSFVGGPLSGRGQGKGTLLAQGGGSEGSEAAVKRALDWLAAHQMPDGGWSFDLRRHPGCKGQCKNPGSNTQARNAATGLALLPFLGAGQTHKSGAYRKVVEGGLYYLTRNMKLTPQGGSFHEPEGRMYSQGICTIVLCEAYAMTHDRSLYLPAQQAVNYICYAQDPVGGGWRYEARQKGDTSVVGWQLMALKSGNMGYLKIPRDTLIRSVKFLDTVQADGGAQYGYTGPQAGRAATTSIGLLCRMYMGWNKETPGLEKGVKWLSDKGPSKSDAYYNYYATQVLRHYEGPLWDKWNGVMRDQLVDSQAQNGHERGSWYFPGGNHNERGGRLYCTAMSTMILEVYYRHLPIYRKTSTEDSFPID